LRIRRKRAYERAGPRDGYRVLVDRVWPRGRSRKGLALGAWAREIAPSDALRRWFGHDAERWRSFQQRYRKELATPAQRARLRALLTAAGRAPLTLVYGARDEEHNQAVVLHAVLARLAKRR
jgi:uncharacterized protein YeaO (DUF488 family)